ncbi:MAG: hypothetical protein CL693_01210 [Cellvibrionaceae bacterium]|nr:hypothetical protein [Cellvibrionaceae bacterium]|tara:strand:- start:73532 stop:74101 length:570 start_codon:yes stop_codon:yes gene_type:complete
MEADRVRWDKRFDERPLTQPSVPAFFVEQSVSLPWGRALDVASGDGAVALWFARQGYDVTAMDISSVALSRLQGFADQEKLLINCKNIDLDDRSALETGLTETYELICLAHFKPSQELLEFLGSCLAPGGQLLLSTFNLQHHQHNGFSKRFCLTPGEFQSSVDGLHCVHYQSVRRGDSFMDDYRWQCSS